VAKIARVLCSYTKEKEQMRFLRRLCVVTLAVSLISGAVSFSHAQNAAAKKAVFIIAADKFQDDEYAQPKEVLEKSGIKVTVASTVLTEITGMNGAKAKADILLGDVKVEDYDAIVFIGGSGAQQYVDDPLAQKIARESVAERKVTAAICLAPVILTNAGVLKGKKATCYPSEGSKLSAGGVNYTAKPVEIDGNIITADGPASAKQFGEEINLALSVK
jgi:protease I